jgi:hypothetical protein
MASFVRQLVADSLPTPTSRPTRFPYGSMRMPHQPRRSELELVRLGARATAPISITVALLVFACCFTLGFAITLVAFL